MLDATGRQAREKGRLEPLTQGVGDESASRRLVSAHLSNGRLRTRSIFAPLFTATQVAAALLVGWSLHDEFPLLLVIGWVVLVCAASLISHCRTVGSALGISGRLQRPWQSALESALLAAIWVSLPASTYAQQSPDSQALVRGATIALILSSVGLTAIPAAATAFIAVLGAAFCLAMLSMTLPSFSFLLVFAVAIGTVARMGRWIDGELRYKARIEAESESIRLLLHEYEHRGVGWLWQTDCENRILYLSARMGPLLERISSDLVGQTLPAVLGGSAPLGQALLARVPFADLDILVQTRHGPRWFRLAGDPISGGRDEFQGFRGVGHDVTEMRKTQERLTHIASVDVLSGLPNRGRVRQLLEQALTLATSARVPCALLFIDLDGFKPVNDRFGHPRGDIVLKNVAQRLVAEVGDAGNVGRMGGDEFAVILCDAPTRGIVEDLADRIIRSLSEPFYLDKTPVRIGASIGCAFAPGDGNSVDDLLQKADLALYRAKAEGRGTCRYFSADLQNEAESRARLERDLRDALATGQFHLLYQPLVDAHSQRLVGFEALVRWKHPTRGIVSPADFIPIAEETGIIVPMGDWVVQEACRSLARWQDVTLAVNVSARQLASPALPGSVRDALARHRVPANRLELEVTESVFMDYSSGALEVLRRLRALGLGIALDDFGTGYSSLGYLNKAVFHKLKIDGSFVREAAENKETVAIIQSIVALARSFRMTVTAEGVETSDDFFRMRDLGCHHIQGYYFGRPMTFDDADAFVRESRKASA